jgi:Lrp/AsnC family leucine-responsive transcriptional regulator
VVAADAIGPLVSADDGNAHREPALAPVVPLRPWIGVPPEQPERRENLPPEIDSIDLQLLRLLQDNGRISNAGLAQAVGLSQAATHDRVRRLTRDGYILGYGAVLNPQLLAADLLVFAEVRVEGAGTGDVFRAAVQVRDEILECHEVAGGVDYLIKTRVADIHAFRDLVASVLWRLPGVRDVRTYAVIEELKSTARIPL